MSKTKIKGKCPECGKSDLTLRENTIFCHYCNKTVQMEFPKTPESGLEIITTLTNYVKTTLK